MGVPESSVDMALRGTGWEAELLGGESPVWKSVIFGSSLHPALDNYFRVLDRPGPSSPLCRFREKWGTELEGIMNS